MNAALIEANVFRSAVQVRVTLDDTKRLLLYVEFDKGMFAALSIPSPQNGLVEHKHWWKQEDEKG